LVYTLLATGEAGSQTSAGAADHFEVQPNGFIRLIKTLNYEERPRWTLTVAVSDGIEQVTADLKVVVTNVNDPPIITGGLHANGVVSEDAGLAALIRDLSAVDEDRDAVQWFIIARLDGEGNTIPLSGFDYFPNFLYNGAIRLNGRLNHERYPFITLTVLVRDRYGGSDSGTFTFAVSDVNEAPLFDGLSSSYALAESASPGTTVIEAIPVTDPEGHQVALDLILGNEDGRFAYDAQARTISTVATFDYEDTSQHPLLFRASDCQDPPACTIEPLESIGGTTVCVLDVNEAPTVHVPAAELRVSTRAEAGSVIYRGITVSDPENHPVALSFSAGTGADLFAFEGTSTDVMLASVISGATG
ncbi:MAG: cadherin repeat domain-containing protein, partial [Proteobacteria bacterium]|nr:cadherin repeat domain-containing protein [Pseudomonadota bacterium]